jgi:hypothetical protein
MMQLNERGKRKEELLMGFDDPELRNGMGISNKTVIKA